MSLLSTGRTPDHCRHHPGVGDHAYLAASPARVRPTADCPCPCAPRDIHVRRSPRQRGPVGDVRAAKASCMPVRLCLPGCHPPSPPASRSTALAPGVPWRRTPNLASALTCRRRERDIETLRRPGGGGAGGALPQTPAQKYRLIYLSATTVGSRAKWNRTIRPARRTSWARRFEVTVLSLRGVSRIRRMWIPFASWSKSVSPWW